MRKKFLSKAVAVLASGAILSGLSCALAISTSAVDISSLPGSKFQYTLTTRKVSSTKFDVVFQVVNNPGITNFHFELIGDTGLKCTSVKSLSQTNGYMYNPVTLNNVGEVIVLSMPSTNAKNTDTSSKMTFSFEFEVSNGTASEHTLRAGMLSYKSETENIKYSSPDASTPSSDATVVVTPSQSVRLGDVDCNGKIDSTDIFYLRQLVLEADGNKLSTTYLDKELKNKNSSWYKSYSFMKCAAVADINHDEWIQSDDADALTLYVAQKGANVAVSNKEINTLFPVTVVYDNN